MPEQPKKQFSSSIAWIVSALSLVLVSSMLYIAHLIVTSLHYASLQEQLRNSLRAGKPVQAISTDARFSAILRQKDPRVRKALELSTLIESKEYPLILHRIRSKSMPDIPLKSELEAQLIVITDLQEQVTKIKQRQVSNVQMDDETIARLEAEASDKTQQIAALHQTIAELMNSSILSLARPAITPEQASVYERFRYLAAKYARYQFPALSPA